MNNPLLQTDGLPLFDLITATDIEPAIDQVLEENRKAVHTLLKKRQDISWENTLQPIEDLDDKLNRVWSTISHLHSVADNNELRQAYNACLPKLSDYATEMGQDKQLYLLYKSVSESDQFLTFDVARKKLIENALREFKLAGMALDPEQQKDYRQIKQKLSQLQNKFEENLLDATHAWSKHLTDEDAVSGLPESVLAFAQQAASNQDLTGWLFTLDFPSYMPVMQYADNATLREEMYTAYTTRASDQSTTPEWDNSNIMREILSLRQRQAELLGYESYAHYSLVRKMVQDTGQVLDFISDLAYRSREIAEQEIMELQEFVATNFSLQKLQAWDINYYSEKLKQHKYKISAEALRPYFPIHQVLDGLFTIVQRLYGIHIKERQAVAVWHKDVRFFDIFDSDGSLRGGFYLDIYARKGKRQGAWMDECSCRKISPTTTQDPVAYLTCNFTPALDGESALLTHDEVITLFHEFGHSLHHILTLIDYPAVSGINGVPWDAVELPSQFMENWCWQRQAIDLIAKHYQSGDLIDDELFSSMIAARNFQSGMQMLRQLELSLFDFQLHLQDNEQFPADLQSLLNQIRQRIAVIIPPAFNRFQNSFSHIFAGGYAAGYYSYKWAEVLSADIFSRFEQDGIFNQDTGQAFLNTILTQGGIKNPMAMFIDFMGREPSLDSLLRHSGLTALPEPAVIVHHS